MAANNFATKTQFWYGTTASVPLYAAINAATGATRTLVAASAGKKIRVLSMHFYVIGAVTATFKTGSTAISGAVIHAGNQWITYDFSPVGHMETVAGDALDVLLSGGTSIQGSLAYILA